MQRNGSPFGPDLIPIKSDGTRLEVKGKDANRAGYPLVAGVTYYYELPRAPKESPYQSVHIKWDSAAILTITVEDSDFVGTSESTDSTEVTSYDTTAGNWIPENPSTAYIGIVSGSGTVANATVTVPGGTAGGCMYHLAQMGSMRTRVKIVVGGTGGVVRVAMNAKD